MSRTAIRGRLSTVLATAAALALAACSDNLVPVQPDASGPTPSSPSLSKASVPDDVVPGEVIVKLKDVTGLSATSVVTADVLAARHGAAKGRSGYAHRFDVLLTAHGNERALAARLAADPDV
jgi:hypothetical protein